MQSSLFKILALPVLGHLCLAQQILPIVTFNVDSYTDGSATAFAPIEPEGPVDSFGALSMPIYPGNQELPPTAFAISCGLPYLVDSMSNELPFEELGPLLNFLNLLGDPNDFGPILNAITCVLNTCEGQQITFPVNSYTVLDNGNSVDIESFQCLVNGAI